MKNITIKIILSLICCSLVIAPILSGYAISQSKDVILDEIEKELLYASRDYANQFSTEFKIQENVVERRGLLYGSGQHNSRLACR